MREVEACPDDLAHTFAQWIKEDLMILMQSLKPWIEAKT